MDFVNWALYTWKAVLNLNLLILGPPQITLYTLGACAWDVRVCHNGVLRMEVSVYSEYMYSWAEVCKWVIESHGNSHV